MSGEPPDADALVYRPSNKHCEPLTAQKPGTKCPRWSASRAQELLAASEVMGSKRVATLHGLAFIAQVDNNGVWHGYPEAWDKIDGAICARWLAENRIKRRDLRQWATREDIRNAWRELEDVG
jgi:hypothetical protein